MAARSTVEDLLRRRLAAQLLAGDAAGSPEAVAHRLLAVQAQDLRAARLAVRSRTAGLTAADVDRSLSEDRSLVVGWLNRGTLHLVSRDDYPWLHALTAPALATPIARRLRQEGVSAAAAERGVATIARALADDGPLTREQLARRLDAARVPTDGQALVHVLGLASLRGLILRGPATGAGQAFVLARDWLGERPPVDRERALAELARRYLAGHGPAGARDLARWAGVPLRDARAGLSAIATELAVGPDGLASLAGRSDPPPLPPPKLLGMFDPVLHGWASRELVTDGHTGVVTVNGIFRAIALVRGRAAATWTLARGEVDLAPFDPLSARVRRALGAEARDVQRFLDLPSGGARPPIAARAVP